MLHFIVLLNLIFGVGWLVECKDDSEDVDGDFGAGLISNLRNDANLDLSVDEEYEDLRAELLAYHTALASLTATQNRRSMMTTPCWELGGICVNVNLCIGFRFLTEIPGCKNRMNVCCFSWNKYKVKDFRDQGIGSLSFPWSLKQEFGGKGVLEVKPKKKKPGGKRGKTIEKKKRTELQMLNAEQENKTIVFMTPSKSVAKHGPIILVSVRHMKHDEELPPMLPDTYKDIFMVGQTGKPTFGTTASTCWARGGVCVDIRDCPDMKIDAAVAGCSWGHKVCCKIFKFGSPTVGLNRKDGSLLNKEVDSRRFWDIAIRNSIRLL